MWPEPWGILRVIIVHTYDDEAGTNVCIRVIRASRFDGWRGDRSMGRASCRSMLYHPSVTLTPSRLELPWRSVDSLASEVPFFWLSIISLSSSIVCHLCACACERLRRSGWLPGSPKPSPRRDSHPFTSTGTYPHSLGGGQEQALLVPGRKARTLNMDGPETTQPTRSPLGSKFPEHHFAPGQSSNHRPSRTPGARTDHPCRLPVCPILLAHIIVLITEEHLLW